MSSDPQAHVANAQIEPSALVELLASDYDLTAPGLLDSVSVPTLIVHGRQDPIPLASSEAAAKAMRATLVVIERSGHVPYVEQPDALFSAVRAFLTQNG